MPPFDGVSCERKSPLRKMLAMVTCCVNGSFGVAVSGASKGYDTISDQYVYESIPTWIHTALFTISCVCVHVPLSPSASFSRDSSAPILAGRPSNFPNFTIAPANAKGYGGFRTIDGQMDRRTSSSTTKFEKRTSQHDYDSGLLSLL